MKKILNPKRVLWAIIEGEDEDGNTGFVIAKTLPADLAKKLGAVGAATSVIHETEQLALWDLSLMSDKDEFFNRTDIVPGLVLGHTTLEIKNNANRE